MQQMLFGRSVTGAVSVARTSVRMADLRLCKHVCLHPVVSSPEAEYITFTFNKATNGQTDNRLIYI